MGKKSNIDFDSLTVADIPSLSDHFRHRYEVYTKGKEAKNKAKTDFLWNKCFEESCSKYADNT